MSIEIQVDHPLQSADDAFAVLNRVFFLDTDGANRTKPEWRRADDTVSAERVYDIHDGETKPPKGQPVAVAMSTEMSFYFY